jgi:hypothetical protein
MRSYCPSSRLPWYRSPEPSPKPGRRDRPLEPDWPETLLLVPELDDMLLSPFEFLSDWMEFDPMSQESCTIVFEVDRLEPENRQG